MGAVTQEGKVLRVTLKMLACALLLWHGGLYQALRGSIHGYLTLYHMQLCPVSNNARIQRELLTSMARGPLASAAVMDLLLHL